jgi:hypothetical protein
MLRRRIPNLVFVTDPQAINAAFAECDFLLHGSGPYLVAEEDVAQWRLRTGKPYGVYGITLPPQFATPEVIHTLNGARFVYFRDSVSLRLAEKRGVTSPVTGFAPDGAFAVDLRNDILAESFMLEHGLVEKGFLCCIPRLRHTPYWLIKKKGLPVDSAKECRNQEMKEHDHAPLREAISLIVRATNLKVLLCPEDETQMAVAREMIFDYLPEDVLERVVWRKDFWLTDEALSVYVRSAGLFGHEMHSPIMCIGNGIPALVVRWAEQTTKGVMWSDIGLGDWLFDFDLKNDTDRFADFALGWALDLPAALVRTAVAQEKIEAMQRQSMDCLRTCLGLPRP